MVVIMEIMIVLNVVFFFSNKEHNVDKLAYIDNQKLRLPTEDMEALVDRRLVEASNWNDVSCKCSNEHRLISSLSLIASFWVISIHLAVKNSVMGRCFI